jgi:hypothetical protein
MAESFATILGKTEGYKLGHKMLDNWELAISAAKQLLEPFQSKPASCTGSAER